MKNIVRKAINRLGLIPRAVVKRMHYKLFTPALERALYLQTEHPTNQLTEDWDNLIILDACRYDTFTEVSTLSGNLEWRMSPASATLEWMREAIGDDTFYDTVYISANPRITRYVGQFHAVDHVWDWGWDEELKVAPPSPVAEATREAQNQYPNKRLVAHFMQPHTPYIGPYARQNIVNGTGDSAGRARALGEDVSSEDWYHELDMLVDGKISEEMARKAYRENLRLALDEVEALISDLEGRTIVTSDHGDLFNERAWPYPRRLSDHPGNIPALNLRKVPWLTVEDDGRRETVSEPPDTEDEFEVDRVTERLQHLGYVE